MNQKTKLFIRRAAVLGAGVMGAQIAAHLANAGVEVVLFDLPGKEPDKNSHIKQAIAHLAKLQPAPLAVKQAAQLIQAATYDENRQQLADCDLIIEAIAEKMEWKESLYRQIAPHIGTNSILVSNTSGLSINRLAQALPDTLRSRFCGVHFFNPPRYMSLVELIPANETSAVMLNQLEAWLTRFLGKGVVRALDTPNFIANRVGIFSILATMHHTQALQLGFDEVDSLTGPKIGRAQSATFRTADVVGLDTLNHVIQTMHDTLPNDPWHAYFKAPAWLAALLDKGLLGQKTGAGIFRKQGKEIQVLDLARQDYRPAAGVIEPEVNEILKIRNPAERFAALRASSSKQARFLWAIFRDVFHYCAYHLASIAHCARDVDLAIRWGFGWAQGPFETWQAAGWQEIAKAIQADINAGLTLSDAPLPAWVFAREGVHEAKGSWSASQQTLLGRSTLPVYQHQFYPETVLGETPASKGETVWENTGVRLWTHQHDPHIAILSFTSKMHAIGDEVMTGIQHAIELAENDFDGLLIWHEAPFSAGANLQQIAMACAQQDYETLENSVKRFQQTSMAIKHARVPVVIAAQGMALGGGCEFFMHAAHRVAALESYIGLVEAGVGLIPAGGACKEFAIRAAEYGSRQATGDVFSFLQNIFNTVAMATVSGSALQAKELGFALPADDVVFNPHELLYIGLTRTRALAEAGYRPPPRARNIAVAGRPGIATLEMMLLNMREGNFISAHDYKVARSLAVALCGGDVEPGTLVNDDWLLAVERREFMKLLKTPETQARIKHMLETGKPLRN